MSFLAPVILTRLCDGLEFEGVAWNDGGKYEAIWYEDGLRHVFYFDEEGSQLGPRKYSLQVRPV